MYIGTLNFSEKVLACAFHPHAAKIATVCRDVKVRILNARTMAFKYESVAHANHKAARLVWVYDDMLSVGFDKNSVGEIVIIYLLVKLDTLQVPDQVSSCHFTIMIRIFSAWLVVASTMSQCTN